MLNHIVIMGRLVRDPELRRTGTGVAVASFRVAVDRDYVPKDGGERKADFIDCFAWRQTGEFISKYFSGMKRVKDEAYQGHASKAKKILEDMKASAPAQAAPATPAKNK